MKTTRRYVTLESDIPICIYHKVELTTLQAPTLIFGMRHESPHNGCARVDTALLLPATPEGGLEEALADTGVYVFDEILFNEWGCETHPPRSMYDRSLVSRDQMFRRKITSTYESNWIMAFLQGELTCLAALLTIDKALHARTSARPTDAAIVDMIRRSAIGQNDELSEQVFLNYTTESATTVWCRDGDDLDEFDD